MSLESQENLVINNIAEPSLALIAYAKTLSRKTRNRTFMLEWEEGASYFVKQETPNKKNVFHTIQAALSFLLNSPMLKPTANSGGWAGLYKEAVKIQKFRDQKFHAPEIIGLSERFLILENLGPTLKMRIESLLRESKTNSEDEIIELVKDASRMLARLHLAGLVHGRASLNDMCLTFLHEIAFIDFEEEPEIVMPLEQAQLRDLLLYLHSNCKYIKRIDGLPKVALEAYMSAFHQDEIGELKLSFIQSAIKDLLSKAAWIHFLLQTFKKHIGRDGRQAIALYNVLKSV